jgi:Tfp pilus assembly protein PilN
VIKTNLSTRPFYNERAVHLAMLVVALVVLAATAFNVSRILRYSRSDTRLATEAARDEARAADLHQQAARLRATVDPQQVELASAGARQANDLIDRRTFSWTELLNRFETTLPDEVRITAVRPSVDREKGIVLRVDVVARGVEDVQEFMENLDATGAFPDVRPPEDRFDDEGLLHTTLEMGYVPTPGKPTVESQATTNTAGVRAAPARPSEQPPATGRSGAPRR